LGRTARSRSVQALALSSRSINLPSFPILSHPRSNSFRFFVAVRFQVGPATAPTSDWFRAAASACVVPRNLGKPRTDGPWILNAHFARHGQTRVAQNRTVNPMLLTPRRRVWLTSYCFAGPDASWSNRISSRRRSR
jgi:hypothetical protein